MNRTINRPRFSGGQYGGALIHHRTAVTSADKLATPIQVSALVDITEGGSTLPNSALNCTISAGNRWGQTTVPTVQTTTPTLNHALRATIAQVTGAEWYDIFLSTAANPLWVGRITEAQRAAGGFIISSVGAVTAGGGATAGKVDLGIVGTGLGSNVNPFLVNTAAYPNATGITPIACADYEYLDLFVQLSVTDLRSMPTLVLTGYQNNGSSTGDWCQFWTQAVTLLTAVQTPLEQSFRVLVAGASNVVFLVDSIAGQGASLDLWADLE